MTAPELRSWQSVQEEVLRRISNRQWKPGATIPSELELAQEFGCARVTVNRALRGLAEAGLLDRRRKAGTRVALLPVRKATLSIPVIRNEIEAKGFAYRYCLLARDFGAPPSEVKARLQAKPGDKLLHLKAVHLADGRPYVFENRWINPQAVPEIANVDFERQSANEWLVANVPFENGDIGFSAVAAGLEEAEVLGCRQGEALFVIDRSTWSTGGAITSVRLTFAAGYRMHTEI